MSSLFHVEEKRLREIGFIARDESVETITEGPWTKDGMYYVSIVSVNLIGGERKEFVLKAPWDVLSDTDPGMKTWGEGSRLISQHVDRIVEWSRKIRQLGQYCPRIEKYDDGTLIQENVIGRDLQLALNTLSPREGASYVARCDEILREIETKLGLKHVTRVYVDSANVQIGKDFILSSDGKVILVNLNFVPIERNTSLSSNGKCKGRSNHL